MNDNILSFTHHKRDTHTHTLGVSNQVKHVRVNFDTSRHTCKFLVCLSLLLLLLHSNIGHFEYVTHTCGHVSEVASNVERRRQQQLILAMFNQTPHIDE